MIALFLLISFVAGFFLDWISVLLDLHPGLHPAGDQSFGFDPVWFCILFLIVIQTSYLTPPMAPAIFYLRGISPPEITLRHDVRAASSPSSSCRSSDAGHRRGYIPPLVLWLPAQVSGV